MKVFRGKDGILYTVALVSPMMVTGSWYEATPLFGGRVRKHIKLSDFTLVSER